MNPPPEALQPAGIDLRSYSTGLRQGPDGIWAGRPAPTVSYPEDGNRCCLEIEEDSYWFDHRNLVIGNAVDRYPPAGPIFDVGGGNGVVSAALQRSGRQVVLIEPGPDGASNGLRRGLPTVVRATIESAEFRPGTLPAIGLFDVLEHIQAEAAFLRTLLEVLQPGGRLYLTVPAHRWLWSHIDRASGHFRRYDRRSLSRSLLATGFRVEWTSHFFVWLPVPIGLKLALPGRLTAPRPTDPAVLRARHRMPRGIAGRLIAALLRLERRALIRGRSLPLGSSLIAVARRPPLTA